MRKVRKMLCLLLTAVMLLSFAACKKNEDTDETTGADSNAQNTLLADSNINDDMPNATLPNDGGTLADDSNLLGSSDKESKADEQSTSSAGRETVRVTISEGMTLVQIFKKLEANGVCSFDELMETAESYDYSYYSLIAARPSNTRAFKLEGYLYPETYEFYKNEKPQDAIGRFLRVGEKYITSADKAKAKAMGYSMDEILTVASIIEKEGANPNEVSKIAAVIYNRLKAGMQLQMDSGIYYIERSVKPYITGDINRYNSLYNMYKCKGLPAGPICNPGSSTINAALSPADVSYLYFCHDSNAKYYYADTYEEHLENLKKAGIES